MDFLKAAVRILAQNEMFLSKSFMTIEFSYGRSPASVVFLQALIEEQANQYFVEQFCSQAKPKTENFTLSAIYAHTIGGMLPSLLPEASRETLAQNLHLKHLLVDGKLEAALEQWFKRLKTLPEFSLSAIRCEIPSHLRARSNLKGFIQNTLEAQLEKKTTDSQQNFSINFSTSAKGLKFKASSRACGKKSFKTLAGKKVKVEFVEFTAATVRQGLFSGFTSTELLMDSQTGLAVVVILPRSKEQFDALKNDPNYLLSAAGAGGGDGSWTMCSSTVIMPSLGLLHSTSNGIIQVDGSKLFRNRDKEAESEPSVDVAINTETSFQLDYPVESPSANGVKSKIKCSELVVDRPFFVALTWKRANSRVLITLTQVLDPTS